MTEAAAQLDLQMLQEDRDQNRLEPGKKEQAIYERDPDRYFFFILLISLILLFSRWVYQVFEPISAIIIFFLIVLMYNRRLQVAGVYTIDEDGLTVPYTWFSRARIPLSQIIRVTDDSIKEDTTDKEFAAIRIFLDTDLLKFNITGLQSPNILLTTRIYNAHDLNAFADEIIRMKRNDPSTPNTLAQRVEDQVNRAWDGRWRLVLLNLIDSVTEFILFILVLEAIIYGISGFSILLNLGVIMLLIDIIIILGVQIINRPQAIVALRPKEIGGPIVYDEAEIVTAVRFIVMCRPYTVHLLRCEMIYEDDATKQVGRMQQIQPPYVEPGELTYAVAQMVGNHTKSTGATIQFSYKEKEEQSEIIYEVPLLWA